MIRRIYSISDVAHVHNTQQSSTRRERDPFYESAGYPGPLLHPSIASVDHLNNSIGGQDLVWVIRALRPSVCIGYLHHQSRPVGDGLLYLLLLELPNFPPSTKSCGNTSTVHDCSLKKVLSIVQYIRQ